MDHSRPDKIRDNNDHVVMISSKYLVHCIQYIHCIIITIITVII